MSRARRVTGPLVDRGEGRSRPRTTVRTGFGLIELVVALSILAVGVLGLVAAATYAQRSFADAELRELAARAAAQVLDSLALDPAAGAGSRTVGPAVARWTLTTDAGLRHVALTVELMQDGRPRLLAWHDVHALPSH